MPNHFRFYFKCSLFFICTVLFFNKNIFAQSYKSGINFQAVAKDVAGNPANTRKIYIEATILKGSSNGPLVFGEYHEARTNEYGIFNIIIGKGNRFIGANDIYSIDWSTANYYFHLRVAITPINPNENWQYNKEWIDLGTVEFGVVPYALQSLSSNPNMDTAILNSKLNIADTANLLFPYVLKSSLTIGLSKKLNATDTSMMLTPYVQKSSFNYELSKKLEIIDTAKMLKPYTNSLKYGDSLFYITPYQLSLHTFDSSSLVNKINSKLNLIDTANLLSPYLKTVQLGAYLGNKLNTSDTSLMLNGYIKLSSLKDSLLTKLNIADTSNMLNARWARDTVNLSNRILQKEDKSNKSYDINVTADYNNIKFPTVKAVKDYVDASIIASVPDATNLNKGLIQLGGDLTGTAALPTLVNNAITNNKIQDGAVTDAKIAAGINPAKVGLGNLTNNPQIYSLNSLTNQVQSFAVPGTTGAAPNWVSTGSVHTLHLPMASVNGVTAGLISKQDYDHFNTAYNNTINSLSTNGNNGSASLLNGSLNIPAYTLSGLTGNVNANTFYAGPISGNASAANFRTLIAADIPNNDANTSGIAGSALKLNNPVYINNILFDGSANVNGLTATTPAVLTFSNNGSGDASGTSFNGSTSKQISYNTIGAAPSIGSSNITTLGNITTGNWLANVIGSNYGGAGTNNGILKSNGAGVVSEAIADVDFQSPISFASPFVNTSNSISIPVANSNTNGYLSSNDWTFFNNKIDISQKAVANGVASLDANGKIPNTQIPSISFSSGYVVTSQSSMLALSSAVVGSIAIRTDNSKNYVLSALPASTLSNWLELLMPASITSVNGHAESNISLTTSDIPEGTNSYFTTSKARNSISATAPLNYNASTGVVSITAASNTASGYLSSADWNTFNNKMGNFSAQAANVFYAGPSSGANTIPNFRAIVASDIPTLNQNTTGNAATANKLASSKKINGVDFDGASDITITANLPNAITFNSSGLGANSLSFNGTISSTVSYNTIGAAPSNGSISINTLGNITTGSWAASIIGNNYGGAGNSNGILKANGLGVVSAATRGTDFEAPISFTAPLIRTGDIITIANANTNTNGFLSASDWNTFNNKQPLISSGSGVTILGGNIIQIGQAVDTTASPKFIGLTLKGLNTAGVVTNSATGAIGTASTTGTGNIVRANTPTLIAPNLGDATATSINTGNIIATTINVSSDITAKRYKLTMPNSISAASTTNIDLSTGNVFTVNMGTNITNFTFTNTGVGTYLIKFVQDATGNRTINFPSAWKWAGGIVPSLTNTANKLDIVTLIYDGVTYYATIVKNF